ncbi:MAG: hypothetical protein AAB319_10175, partial [Pseudomonadota bacterium]
LEAENDFLEARGVAVHREFPPNRNSAILQGFAVFQEKLAVRRPTKRHTPHGWPAKGRRKR